MLFPCTCTACSCCTAGTSRPNTDREAIFVHLWDGPVTQLAMESAAAGLYNLLKIPDDPITPPTTLIDPITPPRPLVSMRLLQKKISFLFFLPESQQISNAGSFALSIINYKQLWLPRSPAYVRRVDLSAFDCSLSSHRHSYISFLFRSHFLD
jgi:hypothetical protein